jgi:centrosomal protein CEP76
MKQRRAGAELELELELSSQMPVNAAGEVGRRAAGPVGSGLVEKDFLDSLTEDISSTLKKGDAFNAIQATIRKHVGSSMGRRSEEEELLVMEECVRGLENRLGIYPTTVAHEAAAEGDPSRRRVYLKVTVKEGKAFGGQAADAAAAEELLEFQVHLQFNGQRVSSRRRVAACVEPSFGETFVFVACEQLPETAGEWTALLDNPMPLHLCLTRHRRRQPALPRGLGPSMLYAQKELVASCAIDWRMALSRGGTGAIPLELNPSGPDSSLHPPTGILMVDMEAIASPSEVEVPFSAADVERAITRSAASEAKVERDFYIQAKGWWDAFCSGSPHLSARQVKIFAEDERGLNRCSCTFVEPVRAGRALDGPRTAARFVSLIPHERRAGVGGKREETWHSPNAMLSRGMGHAEDHAILLCSLLLGFGLDAYVCLGTASAQEVGAGSATSEPVPHAWVCTFSGAHGNQAVTFWESLTGARYPQPGPHSVNESKLTRSRKRGHFLTVTCMFSHCSFYANRQADDRLPRVLFDIGDHNLWKKLDPQKISCLPRPYASAVLRPPTIDPAIASENVELALQSLIRTERESLGLASTWDDSLSYMLAPALAAYEAERCAGISFGGEDFEDAIRRRVPEGHCFKGFPACYSHPHPASIMASLRDSPVASDILRTVGDYARLALRVRVFPYAGDVVAVWVMFACRYHKS